MGLGWPGHRGGPGTFYPEPKDENFLHSTQKLLTCCCSTLLSLSAGSEGSHRLCVTHSNLICISCPVCECVCVCVSVCRWISTMRLSDLFLWEINVVLPAWSPTALESDVCETAITLPLVLTRTSLSIFFLNLTTWLKTHRWACMYELSQLGRVPPGGSAPGEVQELIV